MVPVEMPSVGPCSGSGMLQGQWERSLLCLCNDVVTYGPTRRRADLVELARATAWPPHACLLHEPIIVLTRQTFGVPQD